MGYDRAKNLASILPQDVFEKARLDFIINGNILKQRDSLRLDVQLEKGNSREIVESLPLQCSSPDDFIDITEVMSNRIKNHFQIKVMEQNVDSDLRNVMTFSAEAYQNYLHGMEAFYKLDFKTAIDWLQRAVNIDSNFTMAQLFLAYGYNTLAASGDFKYLNLARDWQKKAYSRKKDMPYKYQLFMEAHRCEFEKKPEERIEWIKKYLKVDSQSWEMWYNLGLVNVFLGQDAQSVEPYSKAMELCIEWGNDDRLLLTAFSLVESYATLERYEEALDIYNRIADIDPKLTLRVMWTYFTLEDYKAQIEALRNKAEGDTTQVTKIFNQRRQEWEKQGLPNTDLAKRAAIFYYNIFFSKSIDSKKAADFLREVAALDPGNKFNLTELAYLLIDEAINVNEGVSAAERAYKIDSLDSSIQHTLGWGYYKQGKYESALKLLENAEKSTAKYDRKVVEHLAIARSALEERN
jgi:tetratricopeptide (TPR) repeat protein